MPGNPDGSDRLDTLNSYGSLDGKIDGSAVHSLEMKDRQQQETNITGSKELLSSSAIVIENERLRKEVLELRQIVSRIENAQHDQVSSLSHIPKGPLQQIIDINNDNESNIDSDIDIDIESNGSGLGLHHRTHNGSRRICATPLITNSNSSNITPTNTGPMSPMSTSTHWARRTTLVSNADGFFRSYFCRSLIDRAGWLIGLLIFQSLSSFILARNETLLQHHSVIVQFLTMLVGAGGNAGNQASVGMVRGIAVGTITQSNAKRALGREFAMGVALSIILGTAGFFRARVFAVPMMETIAITSSLFLIVVISVVVGATLPLCMEWVGIDPAHSSTTIQVVMDITGVVITVHVCSFLLESAPDVGNALLENEFAE
eukprot:CAMPEP_0201183018 /NCGR_PEP_ID=MMETSP0851-20130426/122664_1 /ASSEMBLY_ACC=CAM_ASM_000631 /TAXON_ID=183588 /ORGANISM="Pseudo-nitzschia fraudulenta, Strain WWA7" /LENGTH=373 /DNA_ID=CAMNT_0047467669 /DNA_START=102 /DNA_END=1223 /DNA_ORIENTATION=-